MRWLNREEELVNEILEKLEGMNKNISATLSSTERIINSVERTEEKLKKIEKTLSKIEKKSLPIEIRNVGKNI